jgi:hypothetical protein
MAKAFQRDGIVKGNNLSFKNMGLGLKARLKQ